ncbi:MAG: phytase [Planctomycetota bacterium]|nr:phytase [Planctomycetota bacterium]
MNPILVLALFALVPPPQSVPVVPCAAQTDPVQSSEDAADDPALWVHPTDPALSLVIGTNKKSGLVVYALDGRTLQTLDDGRMNNVDVVQGPGKPGLVIASNRSDQTLALYRVDAAARQLVRVEGPAIPTGLDEVYGLCAYTDPASRRTIAVVGSKGGVVRFIDLQDDAFKPAARVVREFTVGGQIEGMAADPERGVIYIGEEDVGLWQYSLNPAAEPARRLVDVVKSPDRAIAGNLAADVEGVTIFDAGHGRGFIIASCQGENRFAVYDRVDLSYRGSFALAMSRDAAPPDRVTETDGIHVHAGSLGPAFPHGVFIAQDDNEGSQQNFKLADWSKVADALRLAK